MLLYYYVDDLGHMVTTRGDSIKKAGGVKWQVCWPSIKRERWEDLGDGHQHGVASEFDTRQLRQVKFAAKVQNSFWCTSRVKWVHVCSGVEQ